jgi:hypothetical protein
VPPRGVEAAVIGGAVAMDRAQLHLARAKPGDSEAGVRPANVGNHDLRHLVSINASAPKGRIGSGAEGIK